MGAIREWLQVGPAKLQALRGETEKLQAERDYYEAQTKLQALIIDDIETVKKQGATYKGNEYQTYETAVAELARKYEGKAEWGVVQTGNIIDVRGSFIAAGGLKVYPKDKKKDKAEKEMEFVQRFLEANSLDHEMVQQFAKEGEIEGRFLGELFWDDKAAMVMLRYRSWADTKYKVEADSRDYNRYLKASWDVSGTPCKLEEPRFAYAKLAGRIHKADEPYPKVAKCLTQIEYLDKAIRDWREINRLFASPIPHFEFKTAAEAKNGSEAINKINWRLKKAITHAGTFAFASPSMEGTGSLEREIINLAKMISGTSGTPVHFLGLPDLMSNRATAENLMELVSASTSRERMIWAGFYQSALTKAIALWNEMSRKTKLDATKLAVSIPYITQETWTKIQNVYLPLYIAKAISLETLLAQIPEVDVDEEVKRHEERAQEAMDRFAAGEHDDEDEEDTEDGEV